MKQLLCLSAVLGVWLLLTAASPAASPHKATLAMFAGRWWGHTRGLTVRRSGRAAESIYSGCCDPVINLDFRITHPRGTASDATAIATVTAVWIRDRSAFTKQDPAPRVGERRVIRLRAGVISETLTGTDYCARTVDKCGA